MASRPGSTFTTRDSDAPRASTAADIVLIQRGQPNGLAALDATGKVPVAQLPPTGSGGLPVTTLSAAAGTPVSAAQALAAGNAYRVTLDKNVTPTLTASGTTEGIIDLVLTQDATGGRTVTWPGSISWRNGVTPVIPPGAGASLLVSLVTFDGGTTWFGDAGTNAVETPRAVNAATQPNFQNAWANVGGAVMGLRFYKAASGLVVVQGDVTNATPANNGLAIFTLPPGYRPSSDIVFPAWGHNGTTHQVANAKVQANGNVTASIATTPITQVALSCVFLGEQ